MYRSAPYSAFSSFAKSGDRFRLFDPPSDRVVGFQGPSWVLWRFLQSALNRDGCITASASCVSTGAGWIGSRGSGESAKPAWKRESFVIESNTAKNWRSCRPTSFIFLAVTCAARSVSPKRMPSIQDAENR